MLNSTLAIALFFTLQLLPEAAVPWCSVAKLFLDQPYSISNILETIVTRNNIVWKLARGCCICYCKTFSLVPDSTECTNYFLPKCAVHYSYHLRSNNIVSQRETTNTEKYFHPRLIQVNLKLSCTQLILVNSKDLLEMLYKLAESHIMPGTN